MRKFQAHYPQWKYTYDLEAILRGELAGLRATLEFALRMAAFVAVPAAVGLVLLGGPIVRVLFQRGEFSAADAVLTAQALTGYAVGLPAFSGTRIAAQTEPITAWRPPPAWWVFACWMRPVKAITKP